MLLKSNVVPDAGLVVIPVGASVVNTTFSISELGGRTKLIVPCKSLMVASVPLPCNDVMTVKLESMSSS